MRLEGAKLEGELKGLPGWEVSEGKLVREMKFGDFPGAMEFVNTVAKLAEGEGHHPDIHIFYNRVLLELSTHDEGGITEKDTALARAINEIGI